MKLGVLIACILGGIVSLFSQDDQNILDGLDFLAGRGVYGTKTSSSLRPGVNHINSYDRSAIEGVFSVLNSETHIAHWGNAYHAIGVIGSVSSDIEFSRMIELVEALEDMVIESPPSSGERTVFMSRLEMAYIAVGRSGFSNWEPFFNKRLDEQHWGGQYPELIRRLSVGSGTKMNVLDLVVFGATVLGEDESLGWIENTLNSKPYFKNSLLSKNRFRMYAFPNGDDPSGQESNQLTHKVHLEAYNSRFEASSVSVVESSDEKHIGRVITQSSDGSIEIKKSRESDPQLNEGGSKYFVWALIGVVVIGGSVYIINRVN